MVDGGGEIGGGAEAGEVEEVVCLFGGEGGECGGGHSWRLVGLEGRDSVSG